MGNPNKPRRSTDRREDDTLQFVTFGVWRASAVGLLGEGRIGLLGLSSTFWTKNKLVLDSVGSLWVPGGLPGPIVDAYEWIP